MTTAISEKTASFVESLGVPQIEFQKKIYHQLLELDFPTTKNEYWKYTRVGKIQSVKWRTNSQHGKKTDEDVLNKLLISKGNFLVIENGLLREDLSKCSITGLTFNVTDVAAQGERFNSLINNSHIFSAINSSYCEQVLQISVAAKTAMTEPLQLIFISCGENIISNVRILIEVDKFTEAQFTAHFISNQSNANFTNVVTEFFVGEHARVTYDKIQTEAADQFHISTEQVHQEKNSYFKINTATLSGALVRNNINIAVAGENCETHMNGVIIGNKNMHVDNHTFVDHQVANCFSNESYKYVLDDKSTGVFNGRVIVQQHAQKINAYQKNTNILLSDFAQIYSKPELEIYADDVKCSHGSTTGQLDDNALFYLQTRGISKDKARKLLVSAFVDEILEQFGSDHVRSLISAELISSHGWTIES